MPKHATSGGRLLTIDEVAEQLRQHRATIYRKVSAGNLPAVRLASRGRGALRVPEAELDAWLVGGRLQPTEEGRRGT
jgi:excisionase family DNA binding protein